MLSVLANSSSLNLVQCGLLPFKLKRMHMHAILYQAEKVLPVHEVDKQNPNAFCTSQA